MRRAESKKSLHIKKGLARDHFTSFSFIDFEAKRKMFYLVMNDEKMEEIFAMNSWGLTIFSVLTANESYLTIYKCALFADKWRQRFVSFI